jgi:hypothetical protein
MKYSAWSVFWNKFRDDSFASREFRTHFYMRGISFGVLAVDPLQPEIPDLFRVWHFVDLQGRDGLTHAVTRSYVSSKETLGAHSSAKDTSYGKPALSRLAPFS